MFVHERISSCDDGLCNEILMYGVELASGTMAAPVTVSSTADDCLVVDALWTGSEIALSWYEWTGWEKPGHVSWLSPDGTRTREDLGLRLPASIAWTGSEVTLAWSEWAAEGGWNVFVDFVGWCGG